MVAPTFHADSPQTEAVPQMLTCSRQLPYSWSVGISSAGTAAVRQCSVRSPGVLLLGECVTCACPFCTPHAYALSPGRQGPCMMTTNSKSAGSVYICICRSGHTNESALRWSNRCAARQEAASPGVGGWVLTFGSRRAANFSGCLQHTPCQCVVGSCYRCSHISHCISHSGVHLQICRNIPEALCRCHDGHQRYGNIL